MHEGGAGPGGWLSGEEEGAQPPEPPGRPADRGWTKSKAGPGRRPPGGGQSSWAWISCATSPHHRQKLRVTVTVCTPEPPLDKLDSDQGRLQAAPCPLSWPSGVGASQRVTVGWGGARGGVCGLQDSPDPWLVPGSVSAPALGSRGEGTTRVLGKGSSLALGPPALPAAVPPQKD